MAEAAEYIDPFAERIAAQRALLAQVMPPRFTDEEIAQRRNQNDIEQQLGMLAAMSGHGPLQAAGTHVLRNAQQQRQPHVTERGVYDPIAGSFTLNPELQREQHRAELGRLEDRSAAARQQWQQARQAAQERADAAELQRQFMAQQNAATRAAMAANREASRQAAQEVRAATIEDRMADDYRTDTKTQQQVLNAHRNLAAIAQKGDAASDIAFVYSYMKMLDPGSVVREGEFATAQNAAGIPDRIRNMYNAAMSGARLNAQQRADMLETAGRLGAEAQSQIDSTSERYTAKAQRRSLNPENITGRVLPNAIAAQRSQGGTPSGAPARVPSRGGAVRFADLPQ